MHVDDNPLHLSYCETYLLSISLMQSSHFLTVVHKNACSRFLRNGSKKERSKVEGEREGTSRRPKKTIKKVKLSMKNVCTFAKPFFSLLNHMFPVVSAHRLNSR